MRRAFRPDGGLADDTNRGETTRVAGAGGADTARRIHTPRKIRIATISTPQTHVLRRIGIEGRDLEGVEDVVGTSADIGVLTQAGTPILEDIAFHIGQLRTDVNLLKTRQEERIKGIFGGIRMMVNSFAALVVSIRAATTATATLQAVMNSNWVLAGIAAVVGGISLYIDHMNAAAEAAEKAQKRQAELDMQLAKSKEAIKTARRFDISEVMPQWLEVL